ncbi:MAG TPA: OsmC family protein [Vitreimonas sp.]|uniref:OsmC family protein n=1 Tax=Vitreimonas sp. TaxID=3069702 RepID=UPI002D29B009|nr:OsmC family protein [Vitreimonas sp.]HYD88239.1 OsmC family protein [Vitreimonas sp.]
MTTALAAPAPTIVNGVNVSALFETIEAVKANAEIAKFNFRAKNSWMGGDRNRSTIKEFTGALAEQRTGVQAFIADNGEPDVLLGEDNAPNPVEWLLHALIGCMTTTTAYHAAARNIVIEAIDSELDGDLDLRGFLGLSEEVRKGYQAIRVRMRVKTKAMPETIKALTQMSPVLDVVSKSVPVTVSVETY